VALNWPFWREVSRRKRRKDKEEKKTIFQVRTFKAQNAIVPWAQMVLSKKIV